MPAPARVAEDREAEGRLEARTLALSGGKAPISSWRWRSVNPPTVFDGAIRHWLSERAAFAGPIFGSASMRS